jgi:hypothetical protein
VTSSGIESATFRLVARVSNHEPTIGRVKNLKGKNMEEKEKDEFE